MQNVYPQLTNTLSVTTLHKKEQGEVLPSLHNLDYNYAMIYWASWLPENCV